MKINKVYYFIFFAAPGLAYFLSRVFSGRLILPQTIIFGPLVFRYYGLFMALAAAFGFYLAQKRAKRYGITGRQAESLMLWLIMGGFLGARLYHVFSSFAYYSRNPIDALKVWNGGLSIYGALLGGLITLLLYKKLTAYGLQLITLLNWLAPSLLLGQIIGRFGNFFNYELYGYPTSLPWKMFVPGGFRSPGFINSSFFHPLFLYEQLGNLLILFYILRREKRGKKDLFVWYVLLYNILRFALEFIRIDSVFWGNIRVNALVSLLLALIALALIVNRKYEPANGS